jgi:hypothetical protein
MHCSMGHFENREPVVLHLQNVAVVHIVHSATMLVGGSTALTGIDMSTAAGRTACCHPHPGKMPKSAIG